MTSDSPILKLLSSPSSILIKQGAEAKVYFSRIFPIPIVTTSEQDSSTTEVDSTATPSPSAVLLKYRFPKSYRHHSLSTSLTAHRTAAEARALLRCFRSNPTINVPFVTCVDEQQGILGLEWIQGKTVRECFGGGQEDEGLVEEDDEEGENEGENQELQEEEEEDPLLNDEDQLLLTDLIGIQLARMHTADVIHGDLTTSNIMLRDRSDKGKGKERVLDEKDEVVLIDFGLSSTSALIEDKAVDLYVLERAFGSTHPTSRHLFDRILEVYGNETERLWRLRREEFERVLELEKEEKKVKVKPMEEKEKEKTTIKNKKKSKGMTGNNSTPSKLNPWEETRRKLDEVRLRGRKRSMVG